MTALNQMIKLGKLDQTTSFEQKDKIMVRECRIIYKRKSATSAASSGQFALASSINPRFYIDPNEMVRRQNAEMIAEERGTAGQERRGRQEGRCRYHESIDDDSSGRCISRLCATGSERGFGGDNHRTTRSNRNTACRLVKDLVHQLEPRLWPACHAECQDRQDCGASDARRCLRALQPRRDLGRRHRADHPPLASTRRDGHRLYCLSGVLHAGDVAGRLVHRPLRTADGTRCCWALHRLSSSR